MIRPIGGFFPLDLKFEISRYNFFSYFEISPDNSILFHNSRSALRFLIDYKKIKTLWLPAYICQSVFDATKNLGINIKFYPIDEDFSPSLSFLEANLLKEDAVLVVNYFGRLPGVDFLSFVKSREDIIWIEDRAQSLIDPALIYGDYVLYSPRKMLGVPDGGVLYFKDEIAPKIELNNLESGRFIEAALLRLEDKDEIHNDVWYRKYVEYENNALIGNYAMSCISKAILSSLNIMEIIKKRSENYHILHRDLDEIALFPKIPSVPFGFMIKIQNRAKLLKSLHDQKIFASVHWADLPASAEEFPFEHKIKEEIVTIPCDQRYGLDEMKFIISVIKSVV